MKTWTTRKQIKNRTNESIRGKKASMEENKKREDEEKKKRRKTWEG